MYTNSSPGKGLHAQPILGLHASRKTMPCMEQESAGKCWTAWRPQSKVPVQPSSNQSSKFKFHRFLLHSCMNYALSLIHFFKKSQHIRGSWTLSKANGSPDTVLSLLHQVALQKWQIGFELVWGLLLLLPTPPQKEQRAEALDACKRIKGFK